MLSIYIVLESILKLVDGLNHPYLKEWSVWRDFECQFIRCCAVFTSENFMEVYPLSSQIDGQWIPISNGKFRILHPERMTGV
jgi:hypothetical protein